MRSQPPAVSFVEVANSGSHFDPETPEILAGCRGESEFPRKFNCLRDVARLILVFVAAALPYDSPK